MWRVPPSSAAPPPPPLPPRVLQGLPCEDLEASLEVLRAMAREAGAVAEVLQVGGAAAGVAGGRCRLGRLQRCCGCLEQ